MIRLKVWMAGVIALVLIVFVIIQGYLSFAATERVVVKEFNARQLVLARQSATGIELYFETLAVDLRSLSDRLEAENFEKTLNKQALMEHFNELKTLGVSDVGVLDANGVLVFGLNAPALEGKIFSFRQYYKDAKKSKSRRDYFLEFIEFKGVKPGAKGVAMAVPIFKTVGNNTRVFNGVVLATFELSTVTERFVAPVESRQGTQVYLIDSRYNVLWAPVGSIFGKNFLTRTKGFPRFQSVLRKMAAGQAGSGEYRYYGFNSKIGKFTKQTQETLIAYSPVRLGKTHWSVGVWASRRLALELITTAADRLIALVLVVIAAIIGASVYGFVENVRVGRVLEKQVDARTAELRISNEELARSNADLEQFAYVASHDLQEPLRMVSSYVQLLAKRYRNKLDKDGDDFIDYAVEGAARMRTLINDLLTYSRVSVKGKALVPTDTSLVLDKTLADLKSLIDDSGAEITRDGLPVVKVDASQLGQVFQNLISNAVKFRGKESPRVHISAEKKKDEWIFSVKDNGIGIEAKYFDRVFTIFQRLHGRETYSGTGIGLALCKRIIERHQGRIWIESEPGKGSVFYFSIPINEKASSKSRRV